MQDEQNSNTDQSQIQKDGSKDTNTNKNNGKLLVVEDDETLVKMYSTKMSMEGITTDTALDGQEALEKLQKNDYDIILLDLMLPNIDGFEVLEKLRASSWPNAKKPVIVFSNLGQQSDIDRAKKLGANDYLVKANLTPNQVVEKLREYMK